MPTRTLSHPPSFTPVSAYACLFPPSHLLVPASRSPVFEVVVVGSPFAVCVSPYPPLHPLIPASRSPVFEVVVVGSLFIVVGSSFVIHVSLLVLIAATLLLTVLVLSPPRCRRCCSRCQCCCCCCSRTCHCVRADTRYLAWPSFVLVCACLCSLGLWWGSLHALQHLVMSISNT